MTGMNDPDTTEIDVHEARRRIEAGSAFIDVREQGEHAEVRTPDARLIPMSTLVDRYQDEVPTDREVLVMCHSGARSARVAQFLRGQGIEAVNVAGGIDAWEREGLPVERD